MFIRTVWISGTLAALLVVLLIAFRRQLREFECFALYVASWFAYSCTALYVGRYVSCHAYRLVYFVGGIMVMAAQVSAVYELLSSLFVRKHRFLPQFTCAVLVLSVVCFSLSTRAYELRPTPMAMLALSERAVSWIVFSSLVWVVWKRRDVDLDWRKRPCGIAVGLLVTVAGDTIFNVLLLYIPIRATSPIRAISPLLFLLAAVIWILTFIRKDTERIRITKDVAHEILRQAETTIFCALTQLGGQQNTPERTKSENGVLTR